MKLVYDLKRFKFSCPHCGQEFKVMKLVDFYEVHEDIGLTLFYIRGVCRGCKKEIEVEYRV